jgi:hypothetical protein
MTVPPGPFRPADVEQICRVLGEAVTGSEIPNLIAPLKAPEAPGEETNTKWKRLFNAVAKAQTRQPDGRPFVRLILVVMNPRALHVADAVRRLPWPSERKAPFLWSQSTRRRQGRS